MPRTLPSLLCIATALFGVALPAQTPPAQTPAVRGNEAARAAVLASEFAGVFQHGDALLGVARNYRVTFGEHDVLYGPVLGREAPRAHRLRLRMVSLRRGNDTLMTTAAHAPQREHDRRSVSYAWPGITERYEPRADGLKQSYLLAARPAGSGDVVIDIRIDTTLHANDDATTWLDEHGHGVTFGEVVGIDAHGERCAGSMRRTADGIELRWPAAFVDRAHYPLELDPLIGTAVQGYAGTDNDFPDVAYDAFSDTYCCVWTQFLGGGQTGIVGSVWLASPLSFGYAFGINQNGDEDSIRVTDIGGMGVFVLVWVNYTQSGNTISGLALEPIQGQSSNVFDIDGPANVYAPIVSGEATAFDDDCLVAWLDDVYGLIGCSVTIDAQFQASATPIIQIAAGNVSEPAFSKQGGDPGLHMITWVDRPIGSPGRVRAQVVDHDMNLMGPAAWIQNTPQNCGFPAVDGDGFKFLVAWEEQELANPSSTDVRGKVVTIGQGGITSVGGVLDLAAVANDIDYAADVALLGDQFGLAFMVADPAALFADDCYVQTLDPAGAVIGTEQRLDLTTSGSYAYEHAPRLIGRRDGDPNSNADDGLVVFADQGTTAPFDSDVGLQAVEALGPGGPIVDLGGGCGPGGLAVSAGPFALGNTTAPLELFGAQPLAIPFVLLGLPSARVLCGVCDFVDPTTAWFVPNTAGTATTTFAIPGTPALIGFALDFQFVTFNVAYVGCPALPGVASSNIVRATIDN